MLKGSAITASGQLWKLIIAVIALLVGSIAPLFPETGIDWNWGTAITVVGYVFALLTIRCAGCKKMWFWEAAKDASLYKPLFTRTDCPCCEHQSG